MRALVVEDNPLNQRVAVALFNRLGFYTEAVISGKEALGKPAGKLIESRALPWTPVLISPLAHAW